jgi:hypothetical protein
MLDRFAAEVVGAVNDAIGNRTVDHHITGGAAAANLVVELMDQTIQRLAPETVVNTWIQTKGAHHIADMWAALRVPTTQCIAEGALALATLWQSAWREVTGREDKQRRYSCDFSRSAEQQIQREDFC